MFHFSLVPSSFKISLKNLWSIKVLEFTIACHLEKKVLCHILSFTKKRSKTREKTHRNGKLLQFHCLIYLFWFCCLFFRQQKPQIILCLWYFVFCHPHAIDRMKLQQITNFSNPFCSCFHSFIRVMFAKCNKKLFSTQNLIYFSLMV